MGFCRVVAGKCLLGCGRRLLGWCLKVSFAGDWVGGAQRCKLKGGFGQSLVVGFALVVFDLWLVGLILVVASDWLCEWHGFVFCLLCLMVLGGDWWCCVVVLLKVDVMVLPCCWCRIANGVAMLMVLLWDGRRKKIIYSLGRDIINLNSLKK